MEKRNFTRVGFTIFAGVTCDGRSIEGEVGNISLRGVFIKNIKDISLGSSADIKITLASSDPEIAINIQAVAVRAVEDGIGFEFQKIDVESFTHLRNIVSYASCDDKIMDEFISYLDHRLNDSDDTETR